MLVFTHSMLARVFSMASVMELAASGYFSANCSSWNRTMLPVALSLMMVDKKKDCYLTFCLALCFVYYERLHTLPTSGCRARSTSLWTHRNVALLATNKRRKPTWVRHAKHHELQPLPNRPSRHLGGWARLWSAEEWASSQTGRPWLYLNRSQWPPAKKSGRECPLTRPSCPPDDPVCQGTEQNWAEPAH